MARKPRPKPILRLEDQVWFTTHEAAQYIRESYETMKKRRWDGTGPLFVRITHPGAKRDGVRYRRDWLDDYVMGRELVLEWDEYECLMQFKELVTAWGVRAG